MSPLILGGGVLGQPPERREEAERPDDQGEPVAAPGVGAGGLGGQPHQEDVPGGDLSSLGQADGEEAGVGGAGPQDPGAGARDAEGRDDLSRTPGPGRGLTKASTPDARPGSRSEFSEQQPQG